VGSSPTQPKPSKTAKCLKSALNRQSGPYALVLLRQNTLKPHFIPRIQVYRGGVDFGFCQGPEW